MKSRIKEIYRAIFEVDLFSKRGLVILTSIVLILVLLCHISEEACLVGGMIIFGIPFLIFFGVASYNLFVFWFKLWFKLLLLPFKLRALLLFKNEIELFKKKIIEYENLLFGISLYYQGIIYLYSDYDQIVQMNKKAYENIIGRGNTAIKEAKKILRKVQENPNEIRLIREFIFPPIYETKRLRILVETYNELFPGRPRNIPLSKEENLKFMKAVANKY